MFVYFHLLQRKTKIKCHSKEKLFFVTTQLDHEKYSFTVVIKIRPW